MRGLLIVLLGLLLGGCGSPAVTPSSAPTGTLTETAPPTATTSPSAAASESPISAGIAELDTCVPDLSTLPTGLQGDPCPSALAAVHTAVGSLGLPILAIYIRPGPFPCGGFWPLLGSPAPVCFGVLVLPGTTMHGWVRFVGSAKVAAVFLYRTLPPQLATSAPPPWQASLAAFEVPPAGWAMP